MDRYESLLDETFEAALETEQVQMAQPAPGLLQERLRLRVESERPTLLAQASEPIAKVDSLQREVDRIFEMARARRVPRPWGLLAVLSGSAVALVGVVVLAVLVVLTRTDIGLLGGLPQVDPFPFVGTVWLLIGAAFAVMTLLGVLANVRARRERRRWMWIKAVQDGLGLSRAQHELQQAEDRLRTHLRDEVILPFLREEIRQLKPPEDRTEIRRLDRTGLVEVHDFQFQVRTPTHEQLERLVAETRSGTIGVSGSRGAGKTTLLRYFCRPDLPDTPLEDKRIRVFVSAPVEYAARDFVLHVFSELCYGLCEVAGVERSAFRAPSSDGDDRDPSGPRPRLRQTFMIRLARTYLLVGALQLVILAVVGLASELRQGVPPDGVADEAEATTEGATSDRGPDGGEDGAGGGEPAATPTSREAERSGPIATFLRTNKKALFDYALALAVLAAVVHWGLPHLARKRDLGAGFGPRWVRPPFPRDLMADPDRAAPWKETYRLALEHLENIHFQQSFSSGWKGSLSTPLLNIDHSLGQSLSARQQSLPDIMTSFRAFIEVLPTRQPVIIAIDELDKMASPDKAEQFLNDIKSIFGIPRCVYIISVSLQAMSRFNRRGLPFRDTFDSAFDEVVHARYFDLEHSTLLLNRRVVGLPPVFHSLCHLFAGGLPRDLIRACRTMLTIRDSIAEGPDEPESLERLCAEMIGEEVLSKRDALEVEALSQAGQTPPVLLQECLREILDGRKDLRRAAHDIRASMPRPSREEEEQTAGKTACASGRGSPSADGIPALDRESPDSAGALAAALAAYLYYLATVQELMVRATAAGPPPSGDEVDRLAGVKPDIGVEPDLAWQRISSLRKAVGLEVEAA